MTVKTHPITTKGNAQQQQQKYKQCALTSERDASAGSSDVQDDVGSPAPASSQPYSPVQAPEGADDTSGNIQQCKDQAPSPAPIAAETTDSAAAAPLQAQQQATGTVVTAASIQGPVRLTDADLDDDDDDDDSADEPILDTAVGSEGPDGDAAAGSTGPTEGADPHPEDSLVVPPDVHYDPSSRRRELYDDEDEWEQLVLKEKAKGQHIPVCSNARFMS
jgi:hypothetical protein